MQKHNVSSADGRPTVSAFDPQEFVRFLDDCDWTEEQKIEFIHELWKIVIDFVDLGFGMHPVQNAMANTIPLEPDSPSVVMSEDISDKQQDEAARPTMLAGAEDS